MPIFFLSRRGKLKIEEEEKNRFCLTTIVRKRLILSDGIPIFPSRTRSKLIGHKTGRKIVKQREEEA